VINKSMGVAGEDLPRLKKQKPFSQEAERATVFIIDKDEIGLLDMVLLDAITKGESCNQ
jgi:hypothetical protein